MYGSDQSFSFTHEGITGNTYFLNLSIPGGGWSNTSVSGAGGSGVQTVSANGVWTYYMYGYYGSLLSSSTISISNVGTVSWTTPPGYLNTYAPYSWSSTGLASPYIDVQKPDGNFFNSSVAASGSATYYTDQIGYWYMYLTDGNGGTTISSSFMYVGTAPTPTPTPTPPPGTPTVSISAPAANKIYLGAGYDTLAWANIPSGYDTYGILTHNTTSGRYWFALCANPVAAGAGSSVCAFSGSLTAPGLPPSPIQASDIGQSTFNLSTDTVINGPADTNLWIYGTHGANYTYFTSIPVTVAWHATSLAITTADHLPATLVSGASLTDTDAVTFVYDGFTVRNVILSSDDTGCKHNGTAGCWSSSVPRI